MFGFICYSWIFVAYLCKKFIIDISIEVKKSRINLWIHKCIYSAQDLIDNNNNLQFTKVLDKLSSVANEKYVIDLDISMSTTRYVPYCLFEDGLHKKLK